MLTAPEFEILKNIYCYNASTKEELIYDSPGCESILKSYSMESIEAIFDSLERRGYLDGFSLTIHGELELSEYRVKNAVILAAGGQETAKMIYSQPQGLYKVNGQPLIERLIEQLKETGIEEIYVVVGNKKKYYFYLEEKLGVTLLVNEQPRKNNVYSMLAAAPVLENTYMCNCDNYYQENPFEPYAYKSYHSAIEKEDSSRELGCVTNSDGRIIALETGKGPRECIYGHAYFSHDFSRKFRKLIRSKIADFRVDAMFWQEFYAQNITELDMYIRRYKKEFIWEFDTIQEVQALDDMFVENVSDEATNMICTHLGCKKSDISNVVISNKGFSNILFTFDVAGKPYILRIPGESGSEIVSREKEMLAQELTYKNGVDETYIAMDNAGIKLASFRKDCIDLSNIYYHDIEFMKKLAVKLRKLHEIKLSESEKEFLAFDPMKEGVRLLKLSGEMVDGRLIRFQEVYETCQELFDFIENDGVAEKTLCHNDLNISNVLMTTEVMELIDWEFAGYNGPAFDFGRIFDAYEPDSNQVRQILESYLGHPPTFEEMRHYCAGVAIHSWYFFCWCIFKEFVNEDTSFYMVYFFHRIKKWASWALPLYKK